MANIDQRNYANKRFQEGAEPSQVHRELIKRFATHEVVVTLRTVRRWRTDWAPELKPLKKDWPWIVEPVLPVKRIKEFRKRLHEMALEKLARQPGTEVWAIHEVAKRHDMSPDELAGRVMRDDDELLKREVLDLLGRSSWLG